MGVIRAAVSLGVVAAAVLWPTAGQAGTEDPVTLGIRVRAIGPGDPTGPAVVQVDCAGSAGAPTSQTFTFDDAGSRAIEVQQPDPTCTVTEPDRGGASGSYFQPTEPFDDRCQYDPTVDSMTVSWGGAEQCGVTITNEYPTDGEAPEPPPTLPPSPPAGPAPAVQITPAFTD